MKYYKNLTGKKTNVILNSNQSILVGAGYVKLSESIYKAINKLYPNLLEEYKELNGEVIKEPVEKKEIVEKNDNIKEKKVIKEPVLKEEKKVIKEPVEKKEEIIKEEKSNGEEKEEEKSEKKTKKTSKKSSKKRGRKPSKKDKKK